MATSPESSRHKSRLLREMSRDLNRSIHSVASSTGSNHGTVSTDSTMTNFDPDKDEAIMSTRPIDQNASQKLPELRSTAKKYGRWVPREQDFVINTSAIGRAFPDFSQGGSSDDSMSIEVGRGAKTRQRTPSRVPRGEYSDNLDSPVVMIGDIQILNTPQRPHTKASFLQDALRNSAARKEAIPKRDTGSYKENIPPMAQKPGRGSPYVSHASRTSSGERRTLAELHAKVADESDGSIIGEERPATVTFQPKNTRFSNGQFQALHPTQGVSKRHKIEEGLEEKLRTASGTPSKPQTKLQANHTANSMTPNPTQQSFLLPNMPEISELVSGTFNNGIPVSIRGGKILTRSHNGTQGNYPHNEVDGIPLPEDERDLYLNIDLLKERVAQLEMDKADFQRTIHDLQQDNYQLQAEKKALERGRRADSALGMADSGSDAGSESNKSKLQAQVASLQTLLDASERKVSNQELRLKTNTIERDQAVTQLAQAYHHNDQLRAENDDLKQENQTLRNHLAQFVSEAEDTTRSWQKEEHGLRQEIESLRNQMAQFMAESEENARNWQKKESTFRKRIQRQDEVVREVQEMTQEIHETTREINHTSTRKADATPHRSSKSKRKSDTRASELDLASKVIEQAQKQLEQIKSANAEHGSGRGRRAIDQIPAAKLTPAAVRPRSRSQSRRRSENLKTETQGMKQHAKDQNVQDDDDDEASDEGSLDEGAALNSTNPRDIGNATNDREHTEDGSDYASIVGPDFMKALRRQVKEVRAAKKEFITREGLGYTQDETVQTSHSVRSSRAPSVKGLTGILKHGGTQNEVDLTGRLSIKSNGRGEEENATRSFTSHHRRHSESSVHARTTRRRRNVTDDMTSAYIIPDLNFNATGAEHPSLSASARRVLDGLCKHDCQNCTVCTRVASFEAKNSLKQSVNISKPIPVSERMPDPAAYEEEPTIRPSVEPGLALATVIKGLEDEVAHLKMEHARILSAYNKHDSSLGMRSRKALKKRLEELLKVIDIKSDQIYALYDVLEGQKQSGQEMSEKEVEVTLLNIGVDAEELTKASHKTAQKINSGEEEDDKSDDDSELDLPWEGIEDTTESIGGKRRQTWMA